MYREGMTSKPGCPYADIRLSREHLSIGLIMDRPKASGDTSSLSSTLIDP